MYMQRRMILYSISRYCNKIIIDMLFFYTTNQILWKNEVGWLNDESEGIRSIFLYAYIASFRAIIIHTMESPSPFAMYLLYYMSP